MRSFQVIKSKLISLKSICSQQSIRNYRFGNRVTKSGYYYSPSFESNKKYLKEDSVCDESENKLTSEELRQKRNELFDKEKKRQLELVNRIEKIEVQVINPLNNNEIITLFMNKNISTPYNCCQHIHQLLTQRTVLAKVDHNMYWDMNRALINDCTLELNHFKQLNTFAVNKAFWRSCSFLLGSVVEKAFKDDIELNLHSWPKPDLNSGSFVYDVVINLDNWKPKHEELRALSAKLQNFINKEYCFERLDIKTNIAKEMFEHNSYKSKQIDSIAISNNNDFVTLYRVGDHIDLSCGPMISNTSQVGSIFVTAVHTIKTEFGPMFRFQGIAIPKQLNLNTFVFSIIRKRAEKLNLSGISSSYSEKKLNESKVEKIVLEKDEHNNEPHVQNVSA